MISDLSFASRSNNPNPQQQLGKKRKKRFKESCETKLWRIRLVIRDCDRTCIHVNFLNSRWDRSNSLDLEPCGWYTDGSTYMPDPNMKIPHFFPVSIHQIEFRRFQSSTKKIPSSSEVNFAPISFRGIISCDNQKLTIWKKKWNKKLSLFSLSADQRKTPFTFDLSILIWFEYQL